MHFNCIIYLNIFTELRVLSYSSGSFSLSFQISFQFFSNHLFSYIFENFICEICSYFIPFPPTSPLKHMFSLSFYSFFINNYCQQVILKMVMSTIYLHLSFYCCIKSFSGIKSLILHFSFTNEVLSLEYR